MSTYPGGSKKPHSDLLWAYASTEIGCCGVDQSPHPIGTIGKKSIDFPVEQAFHDVDFVDGVGVDREPLGVRRPDQLLARKQEMRVHRLGPNSLGPPQDIPGLGHSGVDQNRQARPGRKPAKFREDRVVKAGEQRLIE